MRGKACTSVLECQYRRITPAYAGKRTTPKYPVMDDRDHPRVCGEKPESNGKATSALGSPPRMRGKAIVFVDDYLAVRITPAYAGKSANISVLSIR